MNHKEKLLELYSQCNGEVNLNLLPNEILDFLNIIGDNIESQKGVFTVLVTLGIHKSLNSNQDIRYHQDNMSGGFSGRSIDTKYITPTLKELNLPSMSESGWLTRSLEQPYPYTKDYEGKIGNKKVRFSFLEIVDYMNQNYSQVDSVVKFLLKKSIDIREKNKVEISPLSNPEKLTIDIVIKSFTDFMYTNYTIPGGSKIPVIIFYTVYQILIDELKRYENCKLKDLGYHTTSDRTSKSSGDIEIFNGDKILESLEIKFNIDITSHMVNRALEKIYSYNPSRYYILSTSGISQSDYEEIMTKINKLKTEHGCQLIVNGLIPTLKYYMRLITNINVLLIKITENILQDTELKVEHKKNWKKTLDEIERIR